MDDQQQTQNDLVLIDVDGSMKPIVEFLAVGETPELISQLIAKSQQPHILQSTPNDAATRFKDRAAFLKWKEKGRDLHWLLGPNGDLAGVIWYGPKQFPPAIAAATPNLPEPPTGSFAIRLYEGYIGHHLSRPFMLLSIKTLVQQKQAHGQGASGIWLQTDVINAAALALYTKVGYREVFRDDTRVTMVLTKAGILSIATS